jgi:hypothetical protein
MQLSANCTRDGTTWTPAALSGDEAVGAGDGDLITEDCGNWQLQRLDDGRATRLFRRRPRPQRILDGNPLVLLVERCNWETSGVILRMQKQVQVAAVPGRESDLLRQTGHSVPNTDRKSLPVVQTIQQKDGVDNTWVALAWKDAVTAAYQGCHLAVVRTGLSAQQRMCLFLAAQMPYYTAGRLVTRAVVRKKHPTPKKQQRQRS